MKQRSISKVEDTSRRLTVNDCATGLAIGYNPTLNQVAVLINELLKMSILLGKKIDEKTAAMMADAILVNYPSESLETLVAILRKGGSGIIGEKIYGNFGLAHFNEWANEYTEAVQLERQRLNKNMDKPKNETFKTRAEYVEAVRIGDMAQKEIDSVKKEKKNKENGYKKFKLEYLNRTKKNN